MIKASLTIYNGCNYSHSDAVKIFKNKQELEEYIKSCGSWMYEVYIDSIEEIEEGSAENENNL